MVAHLFLSTRERHILAIAESWIGTPYRHQSKTKHIGCDCLGFVLGVWYELGGYTLDVDNTYSRDWAECTQKDKLLNAAFSHLIPVDNKSARPGDILVFRWTPFTVSKHLGIIANSSEMIHAFERHCVTKAPLVASWQRRISGTFRFPLFSA